LALGVVARRLVRAKSGASSVNDDRRRVAAPNTSNQFAVVLVPSVINLGETCMTPEAIKAMMEELSKKRDR
jgi:hypothetical protein